MFSAKGKEIKVVDGYKFRFHKRLANGSKWRACTVKSCKAFFRINVQEEVVDWSVDHGHSASDENTTQKERLNNAVKWQAVEDLCEQLSKLIRRQLQDAKALINISSADIN